MTPNGNVLSKIVMILLATAVTNGCHDEVAEVAREAADRQARQNQQMAQLQSEVARGSRQLVEEDGKARRQALAVHRDLQTERSQLSQGWNQLETERQAIAGQRRTESFLSSLTVGSGAVLAGLFALAVAWLALFGLRREEEAAADACVLLVEDLTAGGPILDALPGPRGPGAGLPRLADGGPAAPEWPAAEN
jgi:hypothetical protein